MPPVASDCSHLLSPGTAYARRTNRRPSVSAFYLAHI
jgi:hypothetical protein